MRWGTLSPVVPCSCRVVLDELASYQPQAVRNRAQCSVAYRRVPLCLDIVIGEDMAITAESRDMK